MNLKYKKGVYLVSLRPKHLESSHIKFNHCYKNRVDSDTISPEISSSGISTSIMDENNSEYIRYATQDEIKEYNRIGGPFDVTNVKSNSFFLKEPDFKKGDWVVFEVDKCVGEYSYCKTSDYWDRNLVLPVHEVEDGVLKFSSLDLNKYAPHQHWMDIASNYSILFRKALSHEIPLEPIQPKRPFKIGDEIVISRKPRTWSSDLNSNCPLFKNNIIYPYTCVIKDIKKINGDKDYTSMTCGKYGWSLDSLIKENLITKINKTDMKEPRPYNLISEVTYEMITTHPYFKTLSYTGLYNIVNSINNRTYHRLIGNSVIEKTELLLKQFKENPSQEIIGYKAKSLVYETSFNTIMGHPLLTEISLPYKFCPKSNSFEKALELNVLDLWFEPVYKLQEETIHMAENFDLTIKNKRVYHITEDITAYVKAIGVWNESLPKKLDKYHFQIDDITLRRTGCQPKTTSIKQWLEIYEKIK